VLEKKWESTGRGHAGKTTGQGEHGAEDRVLDTELRLEVPEPLLQEIESLNEGI
jgi:hypothetical protein